MRILIHILTILLLCITCKKGNCTYEIPDYLTYKGKTYEIYTNALEEYFNIHGRPDSIIYRTSERVMGCSRGYIAHWEIKNDSLFLNKLQDIMEKEIDLKLIFKDRQVKGRVFANWYNDTIINPYGKSIYNDFAFEKTYEYERKLVFKKGILSKVSTKDNPYYDYGIIYVRCEKMPEFPGGEWALKRYLIDNTKTPKSAKSKGISGKVYVGFIVSKDGSLVELRILKPNAPSLNKEAVKIVKSMPKWTPGSHNGKPVSVYMSVPINFKLYH